MTDGVQTAVADSGPLIYLNLVNAIDLLPKMFGTVYVPSIVLQELRSLKDPSLESVRRWAQSPPSWVVLKDPSKIDQTLQGLQRGEIAAISLAQEIRADRILVDDGDARTVAGQKDRKLTPTGTLGILDVAAERGHIQDLHERLDYLVGKTLFRCGAKCRGIILEMKGKDLERKLAQELEYRAQELEREQAAAEKSSPQKDRSHERQSTQTRKLKKDFSREM
jgi:predicted nucleic acid-binding protein